MAEYGLELCPTGWTRKDAGGNGATIDHVFLRNYSFDRFDARCFDSYGISDHELIKVVPRHTAPIDRMSEKTPTGFKVHWEKFLKDLLTAHIGSILETVDPDGIVEKMYLLLEEVRERACSEHTFRKKEVPLKPWISHGLLRSIRTRDKMWQKLKCKPNGEFARLNFNNVRNKSRECLRKAERRFLAKSSRLSGDPRSSWAIINEYIRGKSSRKVHPSFLSGNNVSIDDPNSANIFSAETGKRVSDELGPADDDYESEFKTIEHPIEVFGVPSFYDIEKIIEQQRNNSTPGLDKITNRILKSCKSFFVSVLNHLCQHIFLSGKYPSRFKEAEVILIHKGGDVENLQNYRSISLPSGMNKVIEKFIVEQLTAHLDRNGVLSEKQFGLRRNRGTQHAILDLQSSIVEAIDSRLISVVFVADFSKAFDCLSYRRFLSKLSHLGVKDTAHLVLTPYFEGRSQRLRCGNNWSDPVGVSCGAPQGGVFAPLAFIIYINDLLMCFLYWIR